MIRTIGILSLGLFISLAVAVACARLSAAQAVSVNPGTFGAMTCQQLWYLEQNVLAEGGVCLKTERARRAFRKSGRCISPDEAILPEKTRHYLEQLRSVAQRKHCAGF